MLTLRLDVDEVSAAGARQRRLLGRVRVDRVCLTATVVGLRTDVRRDVAEVAEVEVFTVGEVVEEARCIRRIPGPGRGS